MERKASKAAEEPMVETEKRASQVSKKSIDNTERKNSQPNKSATTLLNTEGKNKSATTMMNRRKSLYVAPKPPPKKKPAVSCGVHLDSTMGVSAETRFKRKNTELISKLSRELTLSYNEIESLLLMYHKLEQQKHRHADGMTTSQFVNVLHETFNMTDEKLNHHVAMVLNISRTSVFSMESWVRAMALFLKGTFEEKMKHCYSVYDSHQKNCLRKDHLLHLMEDCFVNEEAPEEVTYDLIEMVLKKLDVDKSGVISYENFRTAVSNEPLLMESFGQCLPDRLSRQSFLTTFTPNRERF